jgi:hypothetical protein
MSTRTGKRVATIIVTKSGDDMFLCRRCTARDDSCVSVRLPRQLVPLLTGLEYPPRTASGDARRTADITRHAIQLR